MSARFAVLPSALAGALVAILLLQTAPPADAKVIHRERSLYSTILVDERGSTLCLQFSVRRDQRNQSCMDRDDPKRMVFPYARMMMMSLLLVPDPQRIMIVGLGGGTLPVALRELYPEATIDVIEIDPAVKTVAETYFSFSESPNLRVVLQDARVYTKRAAARAETYDLIMLDAFNGDYIPEHLMTQEYLEETRALLAPGGVVAANTFAISRLYDHESTTYREVFGTFYNVRSNVSSNRIILAMAEGLPEKAALATAARSLAPRLLAYDVRVNEHLPTISSEPDWDETARILTDQYSPANLLRNQ